MTAVWLPDVLSDAFRGVRGYQVDTVSGWRTRSANSTAFEPRGVMNHHTGGGGYEALLNFMSVGSSIAPLSQVATSRPHSIGGIQTVRITIMAAGRCNHAGKGHWSWTGTDGGNRYCIGIENQNDGRQSWPKQQVEGIHIATAAILKHLKRDERYAIDHKDYAPTRKPDRHSTTRTQEQAAIKAVLQGGVLLPPKEDNMPTVNEIVGGIMNHEITLANWAKDRWGNDKLSVSSLLRAGYAYAHRAYDQGADNATQLASIRSQLTEIRSNQVSLAAIVDSVVAALPPGQSGNINVEALADLVAEKAVTLHGKRLHHPM